jgi:hypothetical protein
MGAIRSMGVGVVGAAAASVTWIFWATLISIWLADWQKRYAADGNFISASELAAVPSWPFAIAGLFGFAIGVAWDRRRVRRVGAADQAGFMTLR